MKEVRFALWNVWGILREISCDHFAWNFKDGSQQVSAKIALRFSPVSAKNFARFALSGIMFIIS